MSRLFAVAAAVLLATGASAADMNYPKYQAAAAQLLPTGLYVTFGAAETFTSTAVSAAEVADANIALASKGVGGDIRLGYDILLGGKIIVGPFVGVGAQSLDGGFASGNEDWGWEAGGRIGRIFNSSDLVYLLAAYRQQHFAFQDTGEKAAFDGAKFGGGIEFNLTNGFMLGTELAYTSYNSDAIGGGVARMSPDEWTGAIRFGYRFPAR